MKIVEDNTYRRIEATKEEFSKLKERFPEWHYQCADDDDEAIYIPVWASLGDDWFEDVRDGLGDKDVLELYYE